MIDGWEVAIVHTCVKKNMEKVEVLIQLLFFFFEVWLRMTHMEMSMEQHNVPFSPYNISTSHMPPCHLYPLFHNESVPNDLHIILEFNLGRRAWLVRKCRMRGWKVSETPIKCMLYCKVAVWIKLGLCLCFSLSLCVSIQFKFNKLYWSFN